MGQRSLNVNSQFNGARSVVERARGWLRRESALFEEVTSLPDLMKVTSNAVSKAESLPERLPAELGLNPPPRAR